jgi:hypothetical protein
MAAPPDKCAVTGPRVFQQARRTGLPSPGAFLDAKGYRDCGRSPDRHWRALIMERVKQIEILKELMSQVAEKRNVDA